MSIFEARHIFSNTGVSTNHDHVCHQDLTPLALELALWGCSDGSGLPWLDRPDPTRLATAIELLDGLGAVDAKGRVTSTGELALTAVYVMIMVTNAVRAYIAVWPFLLYTSAYNVLCAGMTHLP